MQKSPALHKIWDRQPPEYWSKVRLAARALKSDGCSGPALQLYLDSCLEHDVHYRTGRTLSGLRISRYEADILFGHRIRQMAVDGLDWHPRTWWHLVGFPMSAWRFVAVRFGGLWAWRGNGDPEPGPAPKDVQSP